MSLSVQIWWLVFARWAMRTVRNCDSVAPRGLATWGRGACGRPSRGPSHESTGHPGRSRVCRLTRLCMCLATSTVPPAMATTGGVSGRLPTREPPKGEPPPAPPCQGGGPGARPLRAYLDMGEIMIFAHCCAHDHPPTSEREGGRSFGRGSVPRTSHGCIPSGGKPPQ